MSRGEQSMVPEPEFRSYYGRPILKEPTWKTPDVPIYLWIGGIAGGSALLAEGAALSGRPGLEHVTRLTAATGAAIGTVALVHDLGRPERFLHMLRVFKPTSPLSVGSYILAPFSSLAGAAAASHVTGVAPRLGRLAGAGAAVFGPPLATYTAALFANTAIPVWHEAHRELPFVFGGSAAAAAGGTAMVLAPAAESGPAARMAGIGAVAELGVSHLMEQRLGMLAEPYEKGLAGRLTRLSRALTVAGLGLSALSRRRPWARRVAGASYAAGSLALRFAVFEAGRESARDPKYVVVPQRERMRIREEEAQRQESGTVSS
ncbi:MAG: NrfD/PsrC family molybdoenzyme membrane anchor subunit [Nocardioides marinisabuli]|uniref:NrfD/PsrC family molybdoenzyme membrane anchor subunit n=1 Tax=Nocardioides marinisabuli TaxID=419476 RepID=UPI00321ABCC0